MSAPPPDAGALIWPKAMIFDVDGTLYAQSALRRRLLLEMIKNPGLPGWRTISSARAVLAYRRALETLREMESHGPIPDCQYELAARSCGLPESLVRAAIDERFNGLPLKVLPRCGRPGLIPLLEYARSHGVRLGVLSDYPAEAKLSVLGIRDFFDVVVCAGHPDIQRFKPDPKGLRFVLSKIGVEPAQAIYVGDRPEVDAEVASRAGTHAAIVGRRQSEPGSRWIAARDFHQLLDLLQPA